MSARVTATMQEDRRKVPAGVTDPLRISVFLMHAAIVGYVVSGWAAETGIALLAYIVLLPIIVLQWLINDGASVISNFESVVRTGRWRDPNNRFEGAFFRTVLNSIGIDATRAQINTGVVGIMFIFWIVGFARMVQMVGT